MPTAAIVVAASAESPGQTATIMPPILAVASGLVANELSCLAAAQPVPQRLPWRNAAAAVDPGLGIIVGNHCHSWKRHRRLPVKRSEAGRSPGPEPRPSCCLLSDVMEAVRLVGRI